ncbi:hypothetical protein DUZ99_12540 [Xylanibacillus composti]|uniref:Phosphoserine phosphatase RsbU n=1 Tax=Xylanibacillus composti TaxID=1572762 RepID=A0A8J4M368_9BACL|nr:PP2C family protein-serine/threonine phosphatase [Xylanibacillus composti]MDT9725799.1 hypothetical protein [Xylanibacillus composti]GIQ69246.1 phosphoserine phosphatase RsbU [Xylanibacillus composti]
MDKQWIERYERMLEQYLHTQEEQVLDQAREISRAFMSSQIGLEEAIGLHLDVTSRHAELPLIWRKSFQFLIEFVVYYSVAFREREELIRSRTQLLEELTLAADVQKSLLPNLDNLVMPEGTEIGVVSVAARKVSGDFYNVLPTERGVKLLVADVAGKSMPAAILMSTIKFTMDSVLVHSHNPHMALQALNRFIVQNSEATMFITMFWGKYMQDKERFYYSSAGHEPALLYKAKYNRFRDIRTDGVALGLSTRFTYKTRSVKLEPGDFVMMYTDGVTESREPDVIDNNQKLRRWLKDIDLTQSAQAIVEELHRYVAADNGYVTPDDQTLLLFRRTAR